MTFKHIVGSMLAGVVLALALVIPAHADYSPHVEYAIQLGFPRRCAYHIAWRESRYQQDATGPWFWNKQTRRWERAHGVFQIIDSTWENTPQGRAGMDYNDGYANAEAAVHLYYKVGLSPWGGC